MSKNNLILGGTGNSIFDDNGSVNYSTDIQTAEAKNNFSQEADRAVEIINSLNNLETEYRETMIQLIKEAKSATQSNDENAKKLCRNNFKYFCKGAGKHLEEVLGCLTNLASIASFFGLGVK